MQQKLEDVSKEKESTIQELRQKLAGEKMKKEESSQEIVQLKEQVRIYKPFRQVHCICLIIIRLKRKVIWQFKLVQILRKR